MATKKPTKKPAKPAAKRSPGKSAGAAETQLQESGRAFPDALDGRVGGALDPDKNAITTAGRQEDDDELEDGNHVQPALAYLHNTNADQMVRDTNHQIGERKKEQSELNAQVQELYAKMETQGFPRPAVQLVAKMLLWDPAKRNAFDVAMKIMRRAHGIPVQEDLFLPTDGAKH